MTLTGSKILIAEDNLALAGVLEFNLRRAGYDVRVAHRGDDALALAEFEPFDLLITDQQMPGLSGEALCARLRAEQATCQLPIVFVTAKGLELDAVRMSEELQVSLVVQKPFSPTELVDRVDRLLKQREHAQEATVQ